MSGSPTYSVIFNGKLLDGFEFDQVSIAFSRLFSITPEKAQQLMGSKRAIKTNIDLQTAQRYKKSLTKIGLGVTIKTHRPPNTASLALEPIEGDSSQNENNGGNTNLNSITCPACDLAQAAGEQCTGCGVYMHKVQPQVAGRKQVREVTYADDNVEASSINIMSLITIAVVAFICSLLWKYIVLSSGRELGIVAWLIGGAIGYSATLFGSRGQTSGVICGVFAVLAILGSKYMVIESYKGDASAVLSTMGINTEELRPLYELETQMAEQHQQAVYDDESMRQFMIEWGFSEAENIEEISADEIAEFKKIEPDLRDLTENPKSYEQWLKVGLQQELEGYSTFELIKEDFSFLDFIFLLLAAVTAFQLGSGTYKRDT